MDKNSKQPCFDDYEVGDQFLAGEVEVTLEMIKEFASKYDPQPIHMDEEAAKDSVFGQLVGSGWHTAALTMRLMVDCKPFGNRPIVGLEVSDFKFISPLKPGDRISASGKITKTRRSTTKPYGYLDVLVETTNQNNQVILSQTWTVLLPTKDA